jgi:hypothetical protein
MPACYNPAVSVFDVTQRFVSRFFCFCVAFLLAELKAPPLGCVRVIAFRYF